MSLQGTIRQFDLFGSTESEKVRGVLGRETQVPIDLNPVMLKGAAGRGVMSLAIRASAIFVLASNDQRLTSHE